MSDSGFSGLPPRTGIGDSAYPPSRADLKAQIIEIRGEAKVRKARERMEGEIIRHEKNGETRIRTDKGEITVRFQTRTLPAEGSRVGLEIPAGNPPRQLTVQVLPERPPVTTHQPPAQNTQERPSAPPLTPETVKGLRGDNVTLTIPKNIHRAPLQLDSLIRLVPYSGTVIQSPVLTETPNVLSSIKQETPFLGTVTDANHKLQFPAQSLPALLSHITVTPQPFTGQAVLSPSPANEASKGLLPFQTRITLPSLGKNADMLPPLTSLFVSEAAIRTENTSKFSFGIQQQIIDARITSITVPPVLFSETGTLPHHALTAIPSIKAGENAGTIIGKTPDGLPVISILQAGIKPSEPLLFYLQFNASNLPVGTAINFIPENKTALSQATGSTPQVTQTPFSLLPFISGSTWPAFEELVQTIQQLNPQALQTIAQSAPNAGNTVRMASAILFFVAAVRGGDINSWLGDKTVNLLRKAGKGEMLERLSRDVTGLSRTTADPVSQDWRTLSLPLYWNGDIHKLQLYYRHDQPLQKEGKEQVQGTRFIFDLELSRMGAVQLDGLHRPQTDGNGRLDLVLRTIQRISPGMQKKMRLTYISTLEQADVTGELLFQDNPERFITIKPENPAHKSTV